MRERTVKTIILLIAITIAAGLVFIGFKFGAFDFIDFCCANGAGTVEEKLPLVPKMPVKGQLSVYFIDVGQGDAALLVSPSGRTMLIDSGESIYANRVERFLNELGVSHIDLLIGTHSHSDHIGSMPRIIGDLGVGRYITSAVDVRSEFTAAVETALEAKTVSIEKVRSGEIIEWDEDCKITVLSPVLGCEYSTADANDGCLILRVEFDETAFIFTGDATVHAEQLSMFHNEMEIFKANVLKIAHHGSTTSSSLGFIETVDADIAVISVGAANPYGHPDFDILNRLSAAGCSIARTDERGTIAAFSDGSTVSLEFQKPER
ncbi:MAG: MBL fold metallo-hydrolase [Clostridia bacterium]|nr:MBL fold metallo-hydrolase [Clostridia bacterium]